MVFAKNFGDEFGLELIFMIPIDDLPRRSGKKTRILGLDAKNGRVRNFGGDSLVVMRFFLGDVKIKDFFAGKSVPKEDFTTIGMGGEGLAARNDFLNNHEKIIA